MSLSFQRHLILRPNQQRLFHIENGAIKVTPLSGEVETLGLEPRTDRL